MFFAMTKLFQCRDPVLRRMVYLGIKELSHIAEDVIIVTSSLTKDMTGKEDLYRGAAIRALCTITDVSFNERIIIKTNLIQSGRVVELMYTNGFVSNV